MKKDSSNQWLIDKLLENDITHTELIELCKLSTPEDLKQLVVRIFDMEEADLLKKAAVTGFTAYVNKLKNKQRKNRYERKLKDADGKFRDDPNKYIVLAEGDSWFNYPLLLSDVLDWVAMEPNIALFSVASGADWFLNMVNQREYVAGLSVHDPHYLLLSGGGNDIVGLSRIAVIVDNSPGKTCYFSNDWVQHKLMYRYLHDTTGALPKCASYYPERFSNGVAYLNKDFFALLMLFKVQYHHVISRLVEGTTDNGTLKAPKFPGLKIITQGYDYPVPDSSNYPGPDITKWYVPLLRMVNHGGWLQMPLLTKGVPKEKHKDVMYAMIFLFNEMMIDVADYFNAAVKHEKGIAAEPSVYHIDNRDIVPENGWTDELHPTPQYFKKVASLYIRCINRVPPKNNKSFIYSKEDLNN